MSKDNTTNRKRLLHYIDLVRSHLRMSNWDVVLRDGYTDDEDAHAETWQHPNHTVLNILIGKEFFDLEPAGVRNTVVHELVHAQHRDVTRIFETANEGTVPALAEKLDDEFHVHMERFVAWIADRIEDTIPLWDPSAKVPRDLPRGCYLHDSPK